MYPCTEQPKSQKFSPHTEILFIFFQRVEPCVAMGRGCHSNRPAAVAAPGGVPGGEEGEAAAGGEGGQ